MTNAHMLHGNRREAENHAVNTDGLEVLHRGGSFECCSFWENRLCHRFTGNSVLIDNTDRSVCLRYSL